MAGTRKYRGEDAGFEAFAEMVTDQDQPIVESQRFEELPADLAAELYVKVPTWERPSTGGGSSK